MATTVTKTVKTSGGDYTSLSAWEAGEQGDLVTADEIRQAECYAMADTTAVIIDGSTTDATRYLRVYTPTAERHAGAWNTGKYYLEVSTGVGITVTDANVYLEGLQILTNGTRAATVGGADNDNQRISDCIFRGGTQPTVYLDGSADKYIWNCIIYGGTEQGLRVFVAVKIYSCTIIGGTYGLDSTFASPIVKNCYASGATAAYEGGTPALTTCASSDATGSAGLQNIAYDTNNFTNVTAGSENLHIPSGSALKDVGTDTSGDAAPMNFTTDIDGDTRTGTWDIGADEYVTAGGTAIPIFINQYRQRWA